MPKQAEPNSRFQWSDAWVFAAMAGAANEACQVDYVKLLAVGDMLQHAIFTAKELRQGLTNLHQYGLVKVVDTSATVTPLAWKLYRRIRAMRGGLFSVLDNALKVLNSPRTKLVRVATTPDLRFINERWMKRIIKCEAAACNSTAEIMGVLDASPHR